MKTQLNCRAVVVLAMFVGLSWLGLESLSGGAMGRAVGWESLPLNIVISADVLVWAVALLAFRTIDTFTATGALVMSGFMLVLPHLAVGMRELDLGSTIMSPAVYNASVLQWTIYTSVAVFGLSWVWDWSDKLNRQQATAADSV